MAEIPEDLLALFTTSIVSSGGRYYVEIPVSEVSHQGLDDQDPCQVAILSPDRVGGLSNKEQTTQQDQRHKDQSRQFTQPVHSNSSESVSPQPYSNGRWTNSKSNNPPVSKNDVLDVEIESVGSKGDGVAKVGSGYVLMVPDTAVGDQVTVQVESVRENYSFARVV